MERPTASPALLLLVFKEGCTRELGAFESQPSGRNPIAAPKKLPAISLLPIRQKSLQAILHDLKERIRILDPYRYRDMRTFIP